MRMNDPIEMLEKRLPTLGVIIFVMLIVSAWAWDIFQTWKAPEPSQTIINIPTPSPAPPHSPAENVDRNGCMVIDGISICDKPSLGLKPLCGLKHNHPKFNWAHNIQAPKSEAVKALGWMTDHIGVSPNFRLLAGDFSKKVGAFATIRNNQRYIVYDIEDNFLSPKNQLYWESLGMLGHELGHHLAGHTAAKNQPNHTRELEADKFAGFILAKLGADLNQAVKWTDGLNEKDTKTHPARVKRAQAAREGWLQAKSLKK